MYKKEVEQSISAPTDPQWRGQEPAGPFNFNRHYPSKGLNSDSTRLPYLEGKDQRAFGKPVGGPR